ncbi:aggregation-promoting factor C-terminal-like domain-containing protein [Streptomyces triticirhizae]|uniref:Lytic transglycosylase domain-containing protein n=1 Tax=Streptomyces triticirhizae TaxID=2483353 RepID=A0A3M2M0E6_9ACTN|nr:transglycosylase SLT domain-containing protein [Streptomyces triticirhizae]RMI43121.1 lytic transglycosylase domain-containing protein [Streptomyces triticirhizae]
MTGISVRGFAVASATAVTSVGAAVGVASGDQQAPAEDIEVVAADATLLAEIPAGTNAQLHTASLTQQAESQSTAAEAEVRRAAQEAARVAAAESAQERRAAAERAAQEEAEREAAAQRAAEEAQAASAAAADIPVQASYTKAEIQAMARQIVGADQFQCFSNIVDHESGWDHTATNPSSGAYGLMQALPGSKMATAGADWQTNPATQIRWGVNYMESRYGSPCGAWEFWQANNWY